MAPHNKTAEDLGARLPTVEGVDHAELDRLDASVPEPDDNFLHKLDEQEAALNNAASQTPQRHALVVLISDQAAATERAESPEGSSHEGFDAELDAVTEAISGEGDLVAELLAEEGFTVDAVVKVERRKRSIRHAIETAVVGGADLVVTVGGTGSGPRDRAPEATRSLLDRKLLGIAEALRSSGLAANSKDAALSRGLAGVSGSTVVVNIAGTRGAIRDGMATLSPLVHHVISEINGQF